MPAVTTLEHFYAKVGDGPDGCKLWTGAVIPGGYGQLTHNRRHYMAHRFAYELAHGPIPGGLCVLHRCDRPACVNPHHLFLGTIADNNADKVAKGRSSSGEQNGMAKLTEADVRVIRCAPGLHREIAERFGVSRGLVGMIRRRDIWREVA